jgi:tartrate dehydratase beta subunit/fumarate hydratase class I family protein
MDLEVVVAEALKLEAGDRVLITGRTFINTEIAEESIRRLGEKFPGVEFTFMGNVEKIAVQKGE